MGGKTELMVLYSHLASFNNLGICHPIPNARSSEPDEKILVLLKWLSTQSPLCTMFEGARTSFCFTICPHDRHTFKCWHTLLYMTLPNTLGKWGFFSSLEY